VKFGDPKVPLELRVVGAALMAMGAMHICIGLYLLVAK
jgi:hypothetical protein